MTYSHIEKGQENLTLHDCIANGAEICDGVLSFFFDEGFWIASFHPENGTGNTVRTDASAVKYYLSRGIFEDCTVFVFRRFFKATLRKELSIETLVSMIREKRCSIEFLYQYADENSRIIKCALHYPRRPYYEECELMIYVDREEYLWNGLREDHVW